MSISASSLELPILSIIIVSFNTKQITLNCLESIEKSLKQTEEKKITEIIIIDNASTDGSVEALQQYRNIHPHVKLIISKENLGFGRANNRGVEEARGKYILFLNSDVIVLDQAIRELLHFYIENEGKIHFLGGKLYNADSSAQASCGPFFSLPVLFAFLFLKGEHFGISRSSPLKTQEVDWVSGACILTRNDYFHSVGGFDEQIFMYMEEIDLFYRAKKRGYHVFFYPKAHFIHLGSASSGDRAYPILQAYKGFLYFYRKHHSRFSFFLLKIMLQLKAVIAVSAGLLIGNSYLVKTYGKAYKMVQMDR